MIPYAKSIEEFDKKADKLMKIKGDEPCLNKKCTSLMIDIIEVRDEQRETKAIVKCRWCNSEYLQDY